MTYERVLVLLDTTMDATDVLSTGLAIGEVLGATVDVFHRTDNRSSLFSLSTGSGGTPVEADTELTATIENAVADRDTVEVTNVSTDVRSEEIVRYISDQDVDLLVVGRTATSKLSARPFSKPIDEIVQTVSIPILAVPEAGESASDYDRLLLPINVDMVTDATLAEAAELAKTVDTTVHVLNIVDLYREAGPFHAGGVRQEFVEQKEQEAADRVEAFDESGIDLEWVSTTTHSQPYQEVHDYITDRGIDLVVVTQYEKSWFARRLLGYDTGYLLDTIDVPALIAPE